MRAAAAALVLGAAGLVLGGCAAPAPPAPPALWLVERVVVHCYRTLADPACYAAPQPGRRLIAAAPTLQCRPL